ncbi:MAG: DMT family transporter, partial [Bacillota bacterium]|nr:DMT family transporter [Bacillota bacterium]
AIVPTLLGHSIFNWALKWVKAALVSVVILGEPVGATILAYIFLNEAPTYQQILGGLVILVGLTIFIININSKSGDSK